jgi:peptidoglycan/LPS O-acetylase OafA/YrhL
VDVFLILSGFVITGTLLSKRDGYWQFIFRRFLRIYPVYAVCVVAALAAALAGLMPERFTRPTLPAHLLLHAAMLQGTIPDWVLPGSSGAILNPAWSISLEWQFYLVAPLLLARRRILPMLVVTAIVYRLGVPHLHGFDRAFLPLAWPLFCVGILFAVLHREARAIELSMMGAAACAMFVPLAACVGYFTWFVVYAAAAGWSGGRLIRRALTLPFVLRLGRWSYAIYAAHEIVLRAADHAVPAVPARPLVVLVLATLGTLCVAALLHKYVERPLMHWRRPEPRPTGLAVSPQRG